MSPKPPRCTTCRRPDRQTIDARLAAGEPLAAISADTGIPTTSLHRHHHNCRSRHIVPAPIADGVILLPVAPQPGQEIEPRPAGPQTRALVLEQFFAEAVQHARAPADRLAVAAHLADLAGMRAVTATDHREIAQVHALLAVSRHVERQAAAQRAAEANPHAVAVTPEAQRIQALLASCLTKDPAEKRWALDQAGFDSADAAAIMGRRPRMRIVASSL